MKIYKIKIEYLIMAVIITVNLFFHLIADSNSGFHGDELMHIESGRHIAAGYMDFPPIIGFLAFIQNLFQSDSLFIHHLFNNIATATIFLLCGLITIELGGGFLAVILTLCCLMFSPGLSASHSLFLPDVFDQLSWTICIWLMVKFCKYKTNQTWIYLGIAAAFGFLTKYSIVFFIGGLVFSVLVCQLNTLKKKELWISILLFILIISPNILWQVNNGLPVFHHFSKLYETQLDKNSQLQEFKSLFIYLNPFTAVFWLCGLFIAPFIVQFKNYRLILFTLFFSFLFLFIAKGKAYYYFPIVLGLLPFGGVFFEHLFQQRKWILVAYLSLIGFSGIFMLPHGIPLLRLDKYIEIYHFKENNDHKIPLPFENYYSRPIWAQILKCVDSTYLNLPPEEKKTCMIWGRHYSQACGINLLGKKYDLPPAFSFHSSCYTWVPEITINSTIIAISDANLKKEYWLQYFNKVEEIATVNNPYASDYKWFNQHIFLCRKLKYNSSELKELFKNEIF